MSLRIAIDIGGTFTDLVAFDADGARLSRAKTLSRPDGLADGVLEVIEKARVPVDRIEMLVHGSTVAINAYLEDKGARTALLTTRGFRDIYEMGRKNRPDMYNLFFHPRRCLVPRTLRAEVDERVNGQGEVLVALDEEQVRALIRAMPSEVEALAICLVHSHASPEHERRVGAIAREELPSAYVSVSTDVSREMREYERTSTAVMNAFVGPCVSAYLGALETALAARDFAGTMLLTQSNGGIMSLESALVQPVRMMESGPAAGVIGAAHVCRELGIENAIAFDMGGTTAKACVIETGEPESAAEYYVGGRMSGLPVQVPFLDIVEVGAGGGSLARIDDAGGLRVGPESAGSAPGPACYGLGGTAPTITDANLIVGHLGDELLGGEMPLDRRRAEIAVGALADKLQCTLEDAASGVRALANSIMANAIRAVTVERGRDPRDYTLVCYGGAGPVHAVELAAELEISSIVVPAGAATFAAFGMLVADLRHDASLTFVRLLSDDAVAELAGEFGGLRERAAALVQDVRGVNSRITFAHRLDLRYAGQFHTLTVDIPDGEPSAESLARLFHDQHERRYSHSALGEAIEITALRVSASRPIDKPAWTADRARGGERTTRDVMVEPGGWVECEVWERAALAPGDSVSGPAVVDEGTTAVTLRSGDVARLTPAGHLMIEVGGAR